MIFGVRYGEGWGEGSPQTKKNKRRSQVSQKKIAPYVSNSLFRFDAPKR